MEKEEIAQLIDDNITELLDFLQNQELEKWRSGPQNKWTTGQQSLHLLQSVVPLNTALSLPRFFIKNRFGKTNRELRSYDEVVARYKERLHEIQTNNLVKRELHNPKNSDKYYLLNRLQIEHRKLEYKIRKISDRNLDELVLPHPLMGKMPVRELLMWTAYHIKHHTDQLKQSY